MKKLTTEIFSHQFMPNKKAQLMALRNSELMAERTLVRVRNFLLVNPPRPLANGV